MKKKEWTVANLFKILFIIFLVFVIFALIFKGITSIFRKPKKVEKTTEKEIQQVEKINTETYSDLENRIKIAAQRYQNDTYQGTLESTEIWILKYKDLKEKNYLTSKLIDPNDNSECNGYVKFIKEGAKITYEPYIKCGKNYETQGYDSSNIK